VTYANDANAAAYGEYWVGMGDIYNSMLLLTLGTGIGGGIIINDQLIVGEQSHGGEVGHIIIDYHPDARRDSRGYTGRLEPYASATGLVHRTSEALAAGAKSSLRSRIEAGEELTPILIGEAADAGDEFAMRMIMDTAMYLGVGVVSLMHTIDPNIVVLGGAMTFGGNDHPLGRKFIDRVRQEVQLRAFPIPAQKTKIEYATLGGDAGYLGAAGLARIAKS
jgi:glucokinase